MPLDKPQNDSAQGWHEVTIGRARLILGDCADVLPHLPKVDLVCTDPPYGIGEHGGAARTRGKPGYSKHENLGWDNGRPEPAIFEALQNASEHQIIGNYILDSRNGIG